MPITVHSYRVTEAGGLLFAVITLSTVPDPRWVQFFRARSSYSRFDFTTATLRRDVLRVELPDRAELASLLETVEVTHHRGQSRDQEFQNPI